MKTNILKEFFGFIRIELCFYSIFLAILAYLLFNSVPTSLPSIILITFLICAASFAYNNVIDKKEDRINRGKINYFSKGMIGKFVIISFIILGILISVFLSISAVLFSILFLITSMTYSFFKIKRYLLIKNLYIGIIMNWIFLLGVNNFITIEILQYWTVIFLMFFTSSILADLRDYKGDKIAGHKTLPIVLGCDKSKKNVYFLLALSSALILLFRFYNFLIFLPFFILTYFLMSRNKFSDAHIWSGLSLIFVVISLVI